MQGATLLLSLTLSALLSVVRSDETHTITFDTSKCSSKGSVKFYNGTQSGFGGQELTVSGNQWSGSGIITDARIYYDNGNCQSNPPGGGCTLLELHLSNQASNSAANSVDISLVDGIYKFTDGIAFQYSNGPNKGAGASCGEQNCLPAFHTPNDFCALVNSGGDNVNLAVTFCGTDSQYTSAAEYGYTTCSTVNGATATSGSSGASQTGSSDATATGSSNGASQTGASSSASSASATKRRGC